MSAAKKKLRIIVGGMVGQFPMGGVAWDYFHYVLGLDQLGHDVYYHEDNWAWPYHPLLRHGTDKPYYTVQFFRNFFKANAPHLNDKWHYVLCGEKHFGLKREHFKEIARTADIFLNVSGACLIPQDLGPHCVKVFLDTDPGYNQIMLSEKFSWSKDVDKWCEMVASHDRHLTYAENIYGKDCRIPRLNFDWRPTRCVVTLPQWSAIRQTPPPPGAGLSTVMTWDWFRGPLVYKGVEYYPKAKEFQKYIHLPEKVSTPMTVVINGRKTPARKIKQAGWRLLDGQELTLTPKSYQKIIADSAGEWSVAKNVYVATRSGWFSCRTACYLAAGRPAVVQDTGWSKYIPPNAGLVPFSTLEEAVSAVNALAEKPAHRADAAYEIAREYLAPDRVLPRMIEAIGSAG